MKQFRFQLFAITLVILGLLWLGRLFTLTTAASHSTDRALGATIDLYLPLIVQANNGAPSVTPLPTLTATKTTPIFTDTPTVTVTASPTATNTPTLTATASQTPTQTPTASPTTTNSPSPTATASQTPTGTLSPSQTPTQTPTATPTGTPTPTHTPTNTPTAIASQTPTSTSTPTPTTQQRLIPIGASYSEQTLALFVAQAIAHNSDAVVTLRVLPITYASNPFAISPSERAANLSQAQNRAAQIEAVCSSMVVPPIACQATVPDIQIQSDAFDPAKVAELGANVDGIFVLGGDQTIAMQVVANSPTETAMATRYLAGIPLGGTSAGAAVQSRHMIAGYTGSKSAWHGLEWGAIDLWYGPDATDQRGLVFGLNRAVIEQHALERGRLARLLQATQRLPANHIGLGVDWGTAVLVEESHLASAVSGAYSMIVVDQESFGAAATAVYTGTRQLLALRNVALHVVPPGDFRYDLQNHQPIFGGAPLPAPNIDGRHFPFLAAPSGAGPLFLTGDLSTHPTGAVTTEFAALAQATGQPTVVLAAGFATTSQAQNAANTWANRLATLGVTNVQIAILTAGTDLPALAAQLQAAGAIFMTGNNQQVIAGQVAQLQQVDFGSLWPGGKVILLDNAAAAVAGQWLTAMPTPTGSNVTIQASDSFIAGYVTIAPGLNMLGETVIEPRLLYDYRYGRLVSHIHAHHELVGLGVERGTALKITSGGAVVVGAGVVMTFDGRYAPPPTTGSNNALAAAWLLLDTFTPQQMLPTE